MKSRAAFRAVGWSENPWGGGLYTVRNYLHGLHNSGESMGDSDLHADFGPVTW